MSTLYKLNPPLPHFLPLTWDAISKWCRVVQSHFPLPSYPFVVTDPRTHLRKESGRKDRIQNYPPYIMFTPIFSHLFLRERRYRVEKCICRSAIGRERKISHKPQFIPVSSFLSKYTILFSANSQNADTETKTVKSERKIIKKHKHALTISILLWIKLYLKQSRLHMLRVSLHRNKNYWKSLNGQTKEKKNHPSF